MWNAIKILLGLSPKFQVGDILYLQNDKEFTQRSSIEILAVGKRNYLYKYREYSLSSKYENTFSFIHSIYDKDKNA